MEKKTQRMKEEKGTVFDECSLGSWTLPSGNIVTGRLMHSPTLYGLHIEIGDECPLIPADLQFYADFVLPEARQRADELAKGLQIETRARTKATDMNVTLCVASNWGGEQ